VFGVVIASTTIIAPSSELYSGFTFLNYAVVLLLFFAGLALGLWMGKLEDTYK
jgi:putative membrane protein